MRRFAYGGLTALIACSGIARAQDMLGDVFAGKLISPETGVYAIYDLVDKTTGKRFLMRQAIVGEEEVKKKGKGFWVEVELMPELGYPVISKMLLTGPANDPKNIHRIILVDGGLPPREVPVSEEAGGAPPELQPTRTSLGRERVALPEAEIDCEHFILTSGDAQDEQTEVWFNEQVRPMGIVRMVSPRGELMLRRYGKGGPDGLSAVKNEPGTEPEQPRANVTVRVESGPPDLPEQPESTP